MINGIKYGIEAVVKVRMEEDNDTPQFAVIEQLYVYNGQKIFLLRALNQLDYYDHLKSIRVEATNFRFFSLYQNFSTHTVFHTKHIHGHAYIIDFTFN